MGSSHKGKIPLKDDFFSSVGFLYIEANAKPKSCPILKLMCRGFITHFKIFYLFIFFPAPDEEEMVSFTYIFKS